MAVTGHSNLQDVKIYIEKAEQKRLAENAVCQVYFNNLVPKAYGMKKIKNLLILGTFVAAVASTNITAAHASCDEGCTYSRQTITLDHMVALAAKHNDSFEVANDWDSKQKQAHELLCEAKIEQAWKVLLS